MTAMSLLKTGVLIFEGALQVFGLRVGAEQPAYRTLLQDGRLELREYPARIVAETVVSGQADEARNAGFRRVAGYIFGGNQRREQVAMTAPVAQTSPESIPMTAPVVQSAGDLKGEWRIQFIMPSKYARPEDLPRPNDPAVRIVSEPASHYAVLRFSGSRSPSVIDAKSRVLLAEVAARGWKRRGPPVAWFYDPPWTLPLVRRNEVAVPVE